MRMKISKPNCAEQINDVGQGLMTDGSSIYIFDEYGNCLADFEVNFCPICGKKLRTTKEETKALDELVKQAQELNLGY